MDNIDRLDNSLLECTKAMEKLKETILILSGDIKLLTHKSDSMNVELVKIQARLEVLEKDRIERNEKNKIYQGFFGFVIKNWGLIALLVVLAGEIIDKYKKLI